MNISALQPLNTKYMRIMEIMHDMGSKRRVKSSSIGLLVLLLLSPVLVSFVAAQNHGPQKGEEDRPFLASVSDEEKENTIAKMSGGVMMRLAAEHGIDTIMGKEMPEYEGKETSLLADNGVGVDPVKEENEPSIAAHPTKTEKLVAFMHSIPDPNCVAFHSSDGGETWQGPVPLPLLLAGDFCSDPIVRYAPDGHHRQSARAGD